LAHIFPEDGIFTPKLVGLMSELLYAYNIVHLIGHNDKYIDPKCAE
jgi:hypothetical protein